MDFILLGLAAYGTYCIYKKVTDKTGHKEEKEVKKAISENQREVNAYNEILKAFTDWLKEMYKNNHVSEGNFNKTVTLAIARESLDDLIKMIKSWTHAEMFTATPEFKIEIANFLRKVGEIQIKNNVEA